MMKKERFRRGEVRRRRRANHGFSFAAVRFADQPERFALTNAQGYLVDRPHPTRRRRQLHRQSVDYEQIAHAVILEWNRGITNPNVPRGPFA